MKLTQLLEALDKRGIGEALLRGGEAMQTRVDGTWTPQGAAIPIGALGAMLESGAPAEAVAQWQSEDRCQFEQSGFLIKAARRDDRVQVALKRMASADASDATQTVYAPATPATSHGAASGSAANGSAASSTVIAAKSALKPAVVEWYYINEGAETGPIAPDRARILIGTGTLGGDTLVWCDGMTDWKPARDSDLRPLLPASALNAVPVAPPVAPIAAPTGDIRPGRVGGGRIHEIPPSHDKFSLGAFTLPLFWCSANKQSGRFWPIFLTGFIPLVGGLISLYLCFQLGSEGNSLAWISREWDSVEHFEKTQRVWTIVGAIMLAIDAILIIFAVIGGFNG